MWHYHLQDQDDKAANAVVFPPRLTGEGKGLGHAFPPSCFRSASITGLHCHRTALDPEDGGNVSFISQLMHSVIQNVDVKIYVV